MTNVEVALGILKDIDPKHNPKKLAPETGLEPVTRRLIPMGRDSTIEQNVSDPTS